MFLSLQDAKCIGSACIGCIKHSCEIDGDESVFEIESKDEMTEINENKSDADSKDEKCYFQNDKGKKIDLDKLSSIENNKA